jgi:ubiquinol-cytochrome c reductase cytochrome b subunit
MVLHGHESGRIVRFANGEYIEVHTPLEPEERWLRVNYDSPAPVDIQPATDARGVRRKEYARDRRWQRVSRFFYEDRVSPVTPAELAAAHSHGQHDTIQRDTIEAKEPTGAGSAVGGDGS